MELLALTATVLLGLLAVLAVGAPAISRLAEAALRRRRYADTYDPARRPAPPEASRPRKPLDLGPDRLYWPSERRDEKPWVDPLEWPSERWDDPYFGRRARAQRAEGRPAEALSRAAAPPRATSQPPGKRVAAPPPIELDPVTFELPASVGEAWVPGLPHAPVDRPPPPPRSRPPAPRRPAPTPPVPSGSGSLAERLPPAEEVRALIRAKGLANALREVAERTGLSPSEVADEVLRRRKG